MIKMKMVTTAAMISVIMTKSYSMDIDAHDDNDVVHGVHGFREKRVMLERQAGSPGRRSNTSMNITKTNTNAITNAKTNTSNYNKFYN